MSNDDKNLDSTLDRHLGLFNAPPAEQLDASQERIVLRLRSKAETSLDEALLASRSTRFTATSWRWGLLAAAAVAFAVLVSVVVVRTRAAAVAQAADSSLYRVSGRDLLTLHAGDKIRIGEILRSNGVSGAVIVLADGSRIEMRAQSELVLDSAADGVHIRLNRGSVIVTAAKQPYGHLYVQTKDVTVSVVGTVFLVNAEEEGSRVAVIQGEVHVQQGESSKKLLAGEQVATAPTMEAVAVSQEIAWSRESSALQALLQRSQVSAAAPAPLKFAAVAIKPLGPSPGGFGLACRGIDGVWNAPWGTYGYGFTGDPASGYPVAASQGRCVGNGALVALVGFAYGLWSQDVSGGPDWVRPADPREALGKNGNGYQIEAVAENPATATTEQLKHMMQAMLADRFKLKVRRETKERDGFALVVAGAGIGLKEVPANEKLSPWRHDGDRLKGKSTLSELALILRGRLVGSPPVVDKTGRTGIYEYELVMPSPGAVSAALEDQLGLRLQAEKVPFQALVIDQAEKPSLD